VLAEKICKVELRSLATVARIDTYDPRRATLDSSGQDLVGPDIPADETLERSSSGAALQRMRPGIDGS
jgi:hypothetical protein